MKYSITKNGVCAKHLCVIDEANKTISTTENGLVFDFSGLSGWSFKAGSDCTFKTGSECTFDTGSKCTFDTDYCCTFKTGSDCTFDTSNGCTFKAGDNCTFKTGHYCTFNAGSHCSFNTGSKCTFKVGINCSLIRYDVKGVTELPVSQMIKLRGSGVWGYEVISDKKKVTIELTDEQIEDLRKQGIDI